MSESEKWVGKLGCFVILPCDEEILMKVGGKITGKNEFGNAEGREEVMRIMMAYKRAGCGLAGAGCQCR